MVFAVWIFFWVFFLIRGFVKGEAEKFRKYAFADYEEKRELILGEDLYAFLDMCEEEMPRDATFAVEGTIDEHNAFRLIYYLYPRRVSEDPDYILRVSPERSQYALTKAG